MNVEFREAIERHLSKSSLVYAWSANMTRNVPGCDLSDDNSSEELGLYSNEEEIIDDKQDMVKGKGFTTAGPAAFQGNILDKPDLVWTEDEWNDSRVLEAEDRIRAQGQGLSEFWCKNYENKAPNYWNAFYRRNKDRFYKDRHYLHVVFPCLAPSSQFLQSEVDDVHGERDEVTLLEVGCGVGNAVFPLLEIHPKLHVFAFDCAQSAVDIVNNHISTRREEFSDGKENGDGDMRLRCVVCDIVREPAPVPDASMNFVLCMYVLSAMPPHDHLSVVIKLASTLRPGGKILMRDYGLYDEAQLRFAKGSKLYRNFYVRQDGTCAYYFSESDIVRIAEGASLQVVENYYIQRQYANRGQKKARYRVWIHAVLQKPL
jgi:methyltransferase-like protein 6